MAQAPKVVHMYVDDAGSTSGDTFVVGVFATPKDSLWRTRFHAAQATERYGHSLHFQKIAPTARDGRYRVSKLLIARLAATYDWWGNYMYVDRQHVDTAYFSGSAEIEYNKWVADMIRWRTRRLGYEYRVTIAHRDRLRADDFIPEKLQAELDLRAGTGMPKVTLETKLARDDDMLQIADLLTSAIHQRYVPSGNPQKLELAVRIEALVKRGDVTGNRRVYPFEWLPRGVVEANEKG